MICLEAGTDLVGAMPEANPFVRPLSHCYEEKWKSVDQFAKMTIVTL